jgi:uncharacterized protein YjiS (DUF1127 family)
MTSLTLARRPSAAPSLRAWLVEGVHTLFAWHERARSRKQLAGLNDRLLRDIGVDRATAARELGKRFWEV